MQPLTDRLSIQAVAAIILAMGVTVPWRVCPAADTGPKRDASGLAIVAEKPALTDEVLLNPGMGLFIMPGL